jgi:hypothetical protein
MPQYQGVWTLEQQAQAQSNQQWVTDPNFKNTTLLLQADGTGSGSQNQTFLDGSTNNFFITRNGNTTQGSFSPFSQAPGYWSNYFDGSGDYISMPSATTALALGSGDWTVECFAYVADTSDNRTLLDIYDGNSSVRFIWRIKTTGLLAFQGSNGTDRTVTTTTVPINAWVHLAICKASGTTRMFINGIQSNTNYTDTNTYTNSGASAIGIISSDFSSSPYLGYISNFRVVKGTALYAANFNPPTATLTAVTNTSLLTCQSNRFVDNSTSALALTIGGNVSVQAFGPFAPALQWTPDVVGGSGYFDGSTDYLGTGLATGLDNISGDFTIEYWQYPLTGGNAISPALGSANGSFSGTASFFAFEEGSNKLLMYLNATQASSLISYTAPTKLTNTWSHVAWIRSGSVITLYLNGTSVATVTYTNTISLNTTNSNTYIGRNGWDSYYWLGYIAGLRVVKGTAVIPPAGGPTTPPTAVSNTQLLLNYTNAGIYDGKMGNVLETAGDAQVSTNPVKYGSGSMKFDGTGDWLLIPNNQMLNLNADFTIEFWIYLNSTSSEQCIFHNHNSDNNGILISVNGGAAGKIRFGAGNGSFYVLIDSSVAINTSTWNHVACTRNNNTWTIYINGVNTGSTTNASNPTFSTSDSIQIGRFTSGTPNALNAYLDDFRITKACRYFTTFTPPQQALPRQ